MLVGFYRVLEWRKEILIDLNASLISIAEPKSINGHSMLDHPLYNRYVKVQIRKYCLLKNPIKFLFRRKITFRYANKHLRAEPYRQRFYDWARLKQFKSRQRDLKRVEIVWPEYAKEKTRHGLIVKAIDTGTDRVTNP